MLNLKVPPLTTELDFFFNQDFFFVVEITIIFYHLFVVNCSKLALLEEIRRKHYLNYYCKTQPLMASLVCKNIEILKVT